MSDIIEKCIDFIIESYGWERKQIERHAGESLIRLCEFIKKTDNNYKFGWSQFEYKRFKVQLQKLIEIREIYQKGEKFVRNSKRGQKKGRFDLDYQIIEAHLEANDLEKATNTAKKHLERIKRNRRW